MADRTTRATARQKKPAANKKAKPAKKKPGRSVAPNKKRPQIKAKRGATRAPRTAGPISESDLERLATAPLDTLTMRRLTPEDLARARGEEPASDNRPTSLPSAPLATIAPRGVFLPDRVVVDVEGDTFPSTKLDEHGRDEAILPAAVLEQLRAKAAEGHDLVDADPAAAFAMFRSALELLPQPVVNWNAAGWLLVAMGECAIRSGDFAAAAPPLKDAMHCPGTIGNPWVHLRLGQTRFELGEDRAADDLARAYMGGGRALFEGLDSKYFALVEQVLKPPPGHDRLP